MLGLRKIISNLPRWQKQVIAVYVDAVIVLSSLWFAFWLRMGVIVLPSQDTALLYVLSPVIALVIFHRLGLYRAIYRYAGREIIWTVAKAVGLYSIVLGAILFLEGTGVAPRSIIIINGLLVALFIGLSRTIPGYVFSGMSNGSATRRLRVVIYGAGSAGVQLASALEYSSEIVPVAFLDDDRALQGKEVRGLKVCDPSAIEDIIDQLGIEEVLLAIPSAPRARRQEIVSVLDQIQVGIRSLPGMADLATGRVRVQDLKRVEIEDILGRDAVDPDPHLLSACVTGKAVMVTGAGGSIGSELCRQIVELTPTELILFERNEYSLYSLLQEISKRAANKGVHVVPILGSVLNKPHLQRVMTMHGIQTVYHAAAYKHVPLVESNVGQGVLNNVFGTKRAALAAARSGVESFVLISTDKAVRPTSIMGASKRLAELVLQCLSHDLESSTRFTVVRFGNVLGSSGSVVPLFRGQIRRGGPITVTEKDVNRYFMTIPEASQLVIQAGTMGDSGDVFLLDMGEPIKIIDLARRMIRLSGLEVKDDSHPDGDIEIQITGLRPGEKLYEELLINSDALPTPHPLIMRARERNMIWNDLEPVLESLEEVIEADDEYTIRKIIMRIVRTIDLENEIVSQSSDALVD